MHDMHNMIERSGFNIASSESFGASVEKIRAFEEQLPLIFSTAYYPQPSKYGPQAAERFWESCSDEAVQECAVGGKIVRSQNWVVYQA